MNTYTLTFTPQQLAVINKALMLAPYGEVAPVVQAINDQLTQPPKEVANGDGQQRD